jgi:metal-responsive CopG/Arc/MetJ family transcriptional regulator
MRTTITIDEELLDELKERAAREGTAVSRLIEDSVRLAARPHADGDAGQPFGSSQWGQTFVFRPLGTH